MIRKFKSQSIFLYFVRSCLILISIGICSYCYTYLGKEHPIKQELVGSGVIEEMTKDLYGVKYTVKFPRQAPISVTKETYYKYEVGEEVTLYRPNETDAEIRGLITFAVNIAAVIAASYLVFNIFIFCGLCRDFFYWGCNHSNNETFEDYLKRNSK
ncbi:hypothetical protein FDH01_gp180 [Acinetobacter phage vB_AbaM_ME3]|uniref:Putative membrane protein n=1 Tax=Acinetobacter phage vB_AbaM_ME3 TaxID=1837876 RepID=A0A172Q0R5_9CAUD|nr:hypothetical protein FDH01_gp180 [Acinetobacter phage vB_AbaM_ME3]AND75442.1 putative membrane protein [Acinetobacter phage vB_AbaM_ME3]